LIKDLNTLKAIFSKCEYGLMYNLNVATAFWAKWEDETPTPKAGDLEPFGTPKC